MFIKQFFIGGDRNFAYLAADETSNEALIIDPSYNPDIIVDFALQKNFIIKYIFNTHSHYDHTNGNTAIENRVNVVPLLYGDTDTNSNTKIVDQAKLYLGNLPITIIHTPGHTQDSICILIEDALFTGDTLFVGKIGGTDLGEQAKAEYNSLHEKLLILPPETRVFPGHNYGIAPESTIAAEKESNPFLLQPDFESFVDLKKNWAEYKRKHGIA